MTRPVFHSERHEQRVAAMKAASRLKVLYLVASVALLFLIAFAVGVAVLANWPVNGY